ILFGGLVLFIGAFAVYAYFLGGIDGLPPLPEHWKFTGRREIDAPPAMGNDCDQKMIMAFGPECEEVKRRIKMILPSKGWGLATDSFEPMKDAKGRVEVKPFSACIFAKPRPDAKFPEITTVRCEVAYLTFDRPVASYTEMHSRKLMQVELK